MDSFNEGPEDAACTSTAKDTFFPHSLESVLSPNSFNFVCFYKCLKSKIPKKLITFTNYIF